MEQQEQQIWQRVLQRQEQAVGQDLQKLHQEALELAAAYRKLLGKGTAREKPLLQQLLEAEEENAAALGGIRRLSGGRGEQVKLWNPNTEPLGRQLQTCYFRTHRCLVEYTARSAEREFGPVFQELAKREAEQCERLARLLGITR